MQSYLMILAMFITLILYASKTKKANMTVSNSFGDFIGLLTDKDI